MRRMVLRHLSVLTVALALLLKPATANAANVTLKTNGSLKYGVEMQILKEDFITLRNKINTIPDSVFDPANYSHESLASAASFVG